MSAVIVSISPAPQGLRLAFEVDQTLHEEPAVGLALMEEGKHRYVILLAADGDKDGGCSPVSELGNYLGSFWVTDTRRRSQLADLAKETEPV